MRQINPHVLLDHAEEGAVRKDPGGRLRIAVIYPNSYAVGMSNLAIHALYGWFNARDDVVCERAFLPDAYRPGQPVRTIESGTPLGDMDVLAFSLSFELDYPNLPRLMIASGIPPFAADRQAPFVLAGGAAMSYNPEPVAPFLDAVVIGEIEPIFDALVPALEMASRRGDVSALATLPGVYLPAHGALPIARLVTPDLNLHPVATQIYTPHTEFGAMTLVEIGRGCPYGCKFCIASHAYHPARWRSLETLLPVIVKGLSRRTRVGLLGASVTDHPQILRLCEEILARGGEPSPASMRAGALTDDILALFAAGHVRTITLAPEAGSERLRRTVGKHLDDATLLSAVMRARRAGIGHLKLYTIIGLPGEQDDDVAAIPALALRIQRESGMRVSLGCSVFIPKPSTPFAREAMITETEARGKFARIRRALQGHIEMTNESPRWAGWQAVLARGGRELASALFLLAHEADTPAVWRAAFRTAEIAPEAYLQAIPDGTPLAWAHIGGTRCSSVPQGRT